MNLFSSAYPQTASASLTASTKRNSRVRVGLAFAALLVMFIAGVVAWLLVSAKQDAPASDYITDRARALNFDKEHIISFVRGLQKDDYQGDLRGALGTLWDGGGNDLDRALLLQALLDRSGVKSHLVQGQPQGGPRTYGVVLDGDGRYAGPALDSDPGAKPLSALPDSEYHTIDIKIRTYAETGDPQPLEEGMTLRTADLVGSDAILYYRTVGGKTVAVLSAAGRELVTTADAATAQRQEVVFTTHAPDGSSVERIRELFAREFDDYPSLFNPANRYAFVVTADWVPDSVRSHEAQTAQGWANKDDALNHVVAYTFLARSDDNSKVVMASKNVAARFISPRITIVSAESSDRSGKTTHSVSLDLRKNDIAVDGPQDLAGAFNTLRSSYDSSLESVVLGQVTGAPAISPADLISATLARRQDTLAERQALLSQSLTRLLDEARPGASLSVSPESKQDYSVSFVYQDDGLHVTASRPVQDALANAKAPDRWVLTGPVITADGVDNAAQETEVALALAAKLPIQYTQHFEYSESPQQWYANSRSFSYGGQKGELTFEQQFTSLHPDLQISVRNYYDQINQQFYDQPQDATITIAQDDLEHSHTVTTWYFGTDDQTTGRTWNMFSRDVYKELKSTGTTTVQVRDRNSVDSDPIELWVVEPDHNHMQITVNNRPITITVMVVAGDFVKNNPTKPAKLDDIPDRTDDKGNIINKYWILDDPNFPILVDPSMIVQSAIPGRVLDPSGRGIANAAVTIQGLDTSATTWPDGQFDLPLIQQPFGEFQLSVEAPGYTPITTTEDFRQSNAFPLSFTLQPEPASQANTNSFVWVSKDNLDSALPGLSLSDHSKRLISDAILAEGDGALHVAVPTFDVYAPYGKVDAWLEINTRTSEIYARMADGLYGSTISDNLPDSNGYKAQQAVISYYSGRIASWYLFAAGAMDSVSMKMDNPQMTLPEMHKHAIDTARQLAKLYDNLPWDLDPGFVNKDAFMKGLQHGLDWADQFYGEAWK